MASEERHEGKLGYSEDALNWALYSLFPAVELAQEQCFLPSRCLLHFFHKIILCLNWEMRENENVFQLYRASMSRFPRNIYSEVFTKKYWATCYPYGTSVSSRHCGCICLYILEMRAVETEHLFYRHYLIGRQVMFYCCGYQKYDMRGKKKEKKKNTKKHV